MKNIQPFNRLLFVIFAAGLCLLAAGLLPVPPTEAQTPVRDSSFNTGWRFSREAAAGGVPVTAWRWAQADPKQIDDSYGGMGIRSGPPPPSDPAWKPYTLGSDILGGKRGFTWFQTTLPDTPGPDRVGQITFLSLTAPSMTVVDAQLLKGIKQADDNWLVLLNGTVISRQSGNSGQLEFDLNSAWHDGEPNVLTVLVDNFTAIQGGLGDARMTDRPAPTEMTILALAFMLLPVLGAWAEAQAAADMRAVTGRAAGTGDPLTLWYSAPAQVWEQALPVGNGRLGAMVFGGVDRERLQLNDITVWSGGPEKTADRPDAYTHLPELRAAIRAGDHQKSDHLAQQYMTCQSGYDASYQTLGDLSFAFDLPAGAVTDYARWLDISRAVCGVEYTLNGDCYKREVFSSAPSGVVVIHLTCNRPKAIGFTLRLSRIVSAQTKTRGRDTLVMTGSTGSADHPSNLEYEAQVRVLAPGGTVTASGTQITVSGADEATVLLAAGTTYQLDYAKNYRGPDPHPVVEKILTQASALSYAVLKQQHVADYQSYFDRVHLDLGISERLGMPTEERLKQYGDGKADPAFAMLFYQFGRYLLISSSRPNNPLPSNSQGLWGDGLDLPWKCDYKSNINFEMNYWPVETANLSACHLPMLRTIESLVAPGEKTAKAYYNAPGWFCAYTTNAWGWTSPGGGLPWGVWTGASGWACQHLWEHYAFTRDRAYLKQVYPVMKGAAEFYLATMIPDADGYLVTSPATSPENQFRDNQGITGSVTEGTAADREIIWDLLTNVIQASATLGEDAPFRAQASAALAKIRPLQIGKAGQLEEWPKDWDMNAPEPHHRHISHLFALHPGHQISALTTPALAAAARTTLEQRGDEGTGWSKAWKINCWARLHDGDHALRLVSEQLELVTATGTDYGPGGGTYPNLFDAHPPFQIDGNFGALSGMTEMLLQSQDRYEDPAHPQEDHYLIELLPALPSAWPSGSVTGLRARGGFEVSEAWANGKLSHATIRSVGGTSCRVRCGETVINLTLKPGESKRLDSTLKN